MNRNDLLSCNHEASRSGNVYHIRFVYWAVSGGHFETKGTNAFSDRQAYNRGLPYDPVAWGVLGSFTWYRRGLFHRRVFPRDWRDFDQRFI